ncbi:MAG: type III pantothenate kinase [Pyrinomonadaceae bacterium]
MLLAIDIGNSSVKFGVFDNELLISRFTIPTVRSQSAEELNSSVSNQLNQNISAIIISSVVPELKQSFREYGEKFHNLKSIFVVNTFDFGLKIKYNPPETIGVDRIVAAFAAARKYGKPCIVCDFGTATTIDAVNSRSEYLGGIIAPGISTLSESLFIKTSKLPRVELVKPESVIGNSTVSSIQSGIFYGYLGLTEGILRRMIAELDEKPRIIATGGVAGLIAENCNLIEIVDENLMLDGLKMIYKISRELHK